MSDNINGTKLLFYDIITFGSEMKKLNAFEECYMKKWKSNSNSNNFMNNLEDNEDITKDLLEYPDNYQTDNSRVNSKTAGKTKTKKHWTKKKKIIVFGCVGLVFVLLLGTAIYAYSIWANPMAQFENLVEQMAVEPSASAAQTNSSAASSANPYNDLVSKSDFSILKNIVNIMLIGVDYAPERDTWGGKHAYHADVMIVLSINTKTNEVNLISLPRDTYAKIPGVDGLYKLNASIDCGGGWPKPSGFEKVCEAAEWMLGGNIPVKYYYAVDMSAVKGLVNSIQGVDFDLDIDFEIQGRKYKKGLQHMDGQAVLDYLRVRKELGSESGDLNRIDRQKRMLIAIFEKLKKTDLLLKLPDILQSFQGSLYYNTSLAQTAGLAAFMYKIDSANIKMHSMAGTYETLFNWRFVFTNQTKRVDLIHQVYGNNVKVSIDKNYTLDAARLLWENVQAPEFIKKANTILAKAKKTLDADLKLPVYVPPASSPPSASSSAKSGKIPKGYQQYDAAVRDLYNKALKESTDLAGYAKMAYEKLKAANTQLKDDIDKLCTILSIAKPNWTVIATKDNEINVDFN